MTKSSNPRTSESPPRIVAFTKDWDDVPTCTTHILREMGKTLPVLWVNSIGTRKPRLAHPAHVGRMARRLASGFKRAQRKENQLRVLSPILIPKAQSRLSQWINRKLFAWQAGRELREMGDGRIEYWCFVPNAIDLIPPDPRPPTRSLIIYYCVDDWTQFHYLDARWMAEKEGELLRRADIVFAVSRYLVSKLQDMTDTLPTSNINQQTASIHYMPHGVEYGKFRAALDLKQVPADIADLRKPLIGFYGNIYPWVDLNLIHALAAKKPEWNFVMIGSVYCDLSRFEEVPNVHFLGRREHDELPRYCGGFDVAIIPYDMRQPRMASVNPVKTRELLAAGVPIVAADLPELREFGNDVLIARTSEEWLRAIEKQLACNDKKAVSRAVAGDEWHARVRTLRSWMDSVSNGRDAAEASDKAAVASRSSDAHVGSRASVGRQT